MGSRCITGLIPLSPDQRFLSHLGPEGRCGRHQKRPGTVRGRAALPAEGSGRGARSGLKFAGHSHDAVGAASLGHLGLQGAGQVEVPPDGIVVGARTKGHEEVPDGVGEGDPAVALEEHGAQAVESPSGHQLPEALGVGLSARMGFEGGGQRSGQEGGERLAIPPAPRK